MAAAITSETKILLMLVVIFAISCHAAADDEPPTILTLERNDTETFPNVFYGVLFMSQVRIGTPTKSETILQTSHTFQCGGNEYTLSIEYVEASRKTRQIQAIAFEGKAIKEYLAHRRDSNHGDIIRTLPIMDLVGNGTDFVVRNYSCFGDEVVVSALVLSSVFEDGARQATTVHEFDLFFAADRTYAEVYHPRDWVAEVESNRMEQAIDPSCPVYQWPCGEDFEKAFRAFRNERIEMLKAQ
jgi:hypothetical protein